MTALHAVASGGTARACPSCGGSGALTLERIAVHAQHLAYAGGDEVLARRLGDSLGHEIDAYRMLECRHCKLGFADPALAPSAQWYAQVYARLDLYPAQRWEYGVVAQALGGGDTVLDYGCGSGEFLASVRQRVRCAIGLDFSAAGVEQAVRRGVDARLLDNNGMPREPVPAGSAQHVVAFHVLEHLVEPVSLFQFASSAAAPEAKLWLAVPSDRRASRVHGEADALDAPPHHLTRWTEQALRAIGARCGWRLVRHAYEPLPTRTGVWEATRRLALYRRFTPSSAPLRWAYRRALAAGVWASRRHRITKLSGFSMLACFEKAPTS
jgi:SAM-dependent methyltransferase